MFDALRSLDVVPGMGENVTCFFSGTQLNVIDDKFAWQYNGNTNGNINVLDDREKEIIDLILKNPQITLDMMVEITGKSKRTISRLVQRLKEKDILKRVGSNKSGKWIIEG